MALMLDGEKGSPFAFMIPWAAEGSRDLAQGPLPAFGPTAAQALPLLHQLGVQLRWLLRLSQHRPVCDPC